MSRAQYRGPTTAGAGDQVAVQVTRICAGQKLTELGTRDCRFEDAVKSAEKAAVLVLVY